MRWVDALKEWNKGSPTWCIARKGTKAYDEVKAIQAGKKIEASAEPKAEAKPMAQGINMREVQRKRKQKAKLEELKQSAKDVVASAMASIPAAAPRKDMMPSMMAGIADIAKKAQAAKEKAWTAKTKDGKVYKRTIGGVVYYSDYLNQLWARDADGSVGDWVGVYLPSENRIDATASDPFEEVVALPIMKEKENTSKTELEEELDVGFVYKPAGRRMEQSIFEDIVRMAGEMERAEDKETSNGKLEQAVPRVVKQLKVGDTLCYWFRKSENNWSNPVKKAEDDDDPYPGYDSPEQAQANAFYTIVSIHNNHTTFRVESSKGNKKILRLKIHREGYPKHGEYIYSYVLDDGDRGYVNSNYVPTPRTFSQAVINTAYDTWTNQLEKEGRFSPRMEMLYEDMQKRVKKADQEETRKREELRKNERALQKQKKIQWVKSIIEEAGMAAGPAAAAGPFSRSEALKTLKKETLRSIIRGYAGEASLTELGGRPSVHSKKELIAMIEAFIDSND